MKEKEIIKGEVELLNLRLLIFAFLLVACFIGCIFDEMPVFIGIFSLIACSLFYVAFLPQLIFGNCKIIVTNKRVYGTAAFGKQIDLPFDKISAVSTMGIINGIRVASSSGFIKFMFIKNAGEVYQTISQLLIERQKENKTGKKSTQNSRSATDELWEYKKLLDEGIITKEEFDKKKKDILNLK